MSNRATRASSRTTRGQNPRFKEEPEPEQPAPTTPTSSPNAKKARRGSPRKQEPVSEPEEQVVTSEEVVTSEMVMTTNQDGTVAVESMILGDLMGESISMPGEEMVTVEGPSGTTTTLVQVQAGEASTSQDQEQVQMEEQEQVDADGAPPKIPDEMREADGPPEEGDEEAAEGEIVVPGEPVTKTKGSSWHKKYDSNRKYKPEWEQYFPWLKRESEDTEMAMCTWCHHRIRPRIYTIEKHGETESHRKMRSKMAWEKKQRMILEAPQTPMCNPRRMAEEYRIQRVMMEIQSSQERFGKPPDKAFKGKKGKASPSPTKLDPNQQQTISYTITPLAAGADPNTVQVQQVQTDPNTMQQVQVVQALPAGAQVVQQVQQGQFAPVEPPKPKKYYPDPVSAHILDQTSGCPAEAIAITLWKMTKECKWSLLSTKHTNSDGRTSAFLRWEEFQTGAYKMHFNTGDYFKRRGLESFYPYTEIVFEVKNADEHFHIPLLISPFGYSTYRGS